MKQRLKKELPSDQARTLYIEGLDMDVENRKLLYKFFHQMWPGKIVSVHLGWRGENILSIINKKRKYEAHAALAHDFKNNSVRFFFFFFIAGPVSLNPIFRSGRSQICQIFPRVA